MKLASRESQNFSDLNIEGHKVKTTANFILQFGIKKVRELVQEFVAQNHVVYDFGRNVFVTDGVEKTIDGKKIYIINMRSPQGIPHIICDTFDHLVEVGVIKERCLLDGQNRMMEEYES